MTIRHALPLAATAEDVARLLPQLAARAATRRGLLLAPLVAALPLGLISGPAAAIDPRKLRSRCPTSIHGSRRLPGCRRTRWRPRRSLARPTGPGRMSC